MVAKRAQARDMGLLAWPELDLRPDLERYPQLARTRDYVIYDLKS